MIERYAVSYNSAKTLRNPIADMVVQEVEWQGGRFLVKPRGSSRKSSSSTVVGSANELYTYAMPQEKRNRVKKALESVGRIKKQGTTTSTTTRATAGARTATAGARTAATTAA